MAKTQKIAEAMKQVLALQADLAQDLIGMGVLPKYAREVVSSPIDGLPPVTHVTTAVRRLEEVHQLPLGCKRIIRESAIAQYELLCMAGYGKAE